MLTARASKFVLSSKTSVPYKSDVCTQRSVGQRVKIKGETRSGGRASTMDESAKKLRFAYLRKLTGRLCSESPVPGRPVGRNLASVKLVCESGLDAETSPDGRSESAHVRVHARDSSDQEVLGVRLSQL
jgi:hypothetical protein